MCLNKSSKEEFSTSNGLGRYIFIRLYQIAKSEPWSVTLKEKASKFPRTCDSLRS